MYRKTRHGIVEPVKIRALLWRRVLLIVGSVLAVATFILVGLWWHARSQPQYPPPTLYTGCALMAPDYIPDVLPCGPQPTAAHTAAVRYGRSALVTGLVAVGLFAAATVPRRH